MLSLRFVGPFFYAGITAQPELRQFDMVEPRVVAPPVVAPVEEPSLMEMWRATCNTGFCEMMRCVVEFVKMSCCPSF